MRAKMTVDFFLYSLLVLHSTDEDIEVEMALTVGANNWYPRLVIFCCSHNVTATSAYVYTCIRVCVCVVLVITLWLR